MWVGDGTAEGTHELIELESPGQSILLTAAGNLIYFVTNNGNHKPELWRSDGTSAGTFPLTDDAQGVQVPSPSRLTVAGGLVYFRAQDNEHGAELWRSDGTVAGTVRLPDISPGPRSSSPQEMAAAGPRLFFQADDDAQGPELWALCLDSLQCSPAP